MQFSANNLKDVAAYFREREEAYRTVANEQKTKKHKEIWQREAATWNSAAYIIENLKIYPNKS